MGHIARRAGADDLSLPSSPNTSDAEAYNDHFSSDSETTITTTATSQLSPEEREARLKRREARAAARAKRAASAKMMDLQYFLEMVDVKHRYGSNLRKYHAYWQQQPTKQNFFYWLDYGDGKEVDLPERSRERLEKEQVRYLSREERLQYLVKIDEQGRLCWAKNGERISTNDELYRDSMKGIVPINDPAPRFRSYDQSGGENVENPPESDDDESEDEDDREEEAEHYANPGIDEAKGLKKLTQVSPAVIFNQLIRTSVKKGNKWIFVGLASLSILSPLRTPSDQD